MKRARLAHESLESGRLVYEADRRNPYAPALRKLVAAASGGDARAADLESDERSTRLRDELVAQGAPLWAQAGHRSATMPLEDLLAEACKLSHVDPSVAKVLPYLFARKKEELDFERLTEALTERKQKHTAGFLLAVAAALTGDRTLNRWAERLRDGRRTKVVDYFEGSSSKRLQALAERNTPKLARDWKFRLNMTMDDFASVMQKFGAA